MQTSAVQYSSDFFFSKGISSTHTDTSLYRTRAFILRRLELDISCAISMISESRVRIGRANLTALRVRTFLNQTFQVSHVYYNFILGSVCRITVNLGTARRRYARRRSSDDMRDDGELVYNARVTRC